MITKKQFKKLKNLNNSKVNEILNIFDEGCWYIYPKGFMQYNKKNGGGYAVNRWGGWLSHTEWLLNVDNGTPRKATEEEIKDILSFAAKEKGLYNVGDLKIRGVYGEVEYGYITGYNDYEYNSHLDILKLDGVTIYIKGKWAEVIQNNSEIKKEIAELENKLQELKNKL